MNSINFLHNNQMVEIWSHPAENNVFFMEGQGPPIYKGDSLSWYGIENVRVIAVTKISEELVRIEVQRHKDKP